MVGGYERAKRCVPFQGFAGSEFSYRKFYKFYEDIFWISQIRQSNFSDEKNAEAVLGSSRRPFEKGAQRSLLRFSFSPTPLSRTMRSAPSSDHIADLLGLKDGSSKKMNDELCQLRMKEGVPPDDLPFPAIFASRTKTYKKGRLWYVAILMVIS